MIFLIVVSHTPRIPGYLDEPGVLTFIANFVVDGLIPLGIPMLTCISGYLVFKKNLDLNYWLLLRKRFSSLVVPLLIWNIPLVIALYFVQSTGIIAYDGIIVYEFAPRRTMYPFEPMVWVNACLALTDLPANYPLHFLRDLVAICLLVPLLSPLARKAPTFGLILIMMVFIPNFDGPLVQTNMMVVTFYIGGIAAAQNWNLSIFDKYAIYLIGLLVVIGSIIVVTGAGRPFWLPLLAPFILWPTASLLLYTPTGNWFGSISRASIFLFLIHGVVFMVLKAISPWSEFGSYAFGVWLASSVLVAFICQLAYVFLDKFFPTLLAVSMGGRSPAAKKLLKDTY